MTSKRLFIVAVVALTTYGCASSPKPSSWHAGIAPVPTMEPQRALDANEPEPGWMRFPDPDPARPMSRERAFKVLLNTRLFASEYVGQGGSKSVQVEAFQVLLDQPDAVDVFADLLHRGHTAGQLYALCGLRLLAPQEYAAAEAQFVSSEAIVHWQAGCKRGSGPARELVRSSRDKASSDISGGAIPASFRDAR